MALTRRTPAFASLAGRTEQLLEAAGATVPSDRVDAVLNHRVDQVAARMGVGSRTALRYAPDDLPEDTAELILEALSSAPVAPTPTGRHLRLVDPAG